MVLSTASQRKGEEMVRSGVRRGESSRDGEGSPCFNAVPTTYYLEKTEWSLCISEMNNNTVNHFILPKQSSDNHFDWYMIKNHNFTPSTHVFPLSIFSLVQIPLLYFVKPRQNRPESPANKQRTLSINQVSCQSCSCTAHQTQLAKRRCILKHSDVYSIISVFWKRRKSWISWVITLRGCEKEKPTVC